MQWPCDRRCLFDIPGPSLRESWARSAELIAALREELSSAGIIDDVRTLYVCGSIGRMEAVASSDCDLVVVLCEDRRRSDSTIMDRVFDCVERIGCQRPKPRGIFGSPTSFEELLDPNTAGVVDEDLAVFGKRIQALLDGQPVAHPEQFESLQRAILQRYADAPVADPTAFKLGWLVDDLIRYWRSLCSRTRWLSHHDQPQWRALNVKLRHSRMLLCAGLYHLLAEAVTSPDPVSHVNELLRLVPLERVGRELGEGRSPEAATLDDYEVFMGAMSRGLVDVVRDDESFARLIANGASMSQTLGERFANRFGGQVAAGLFGEIR